MNWRTFKEKKAVHIILVLIVFCCTGLTVARLGRFLADWADIDRFSVLYWVMWVFPLLPIYYVLLLCYAFLLGKYGYFRAKVGKTWGRVKGVFGKRD